MINASICHRDIHAMCGLELGFLLQRLRTTSHLKNEISVREQHFLFKKTFLTYKNTIVYMRNHKLRTIYNSIPYNFIVYNACNSSIITVFLLLMKYFKSAIKLKIVRNTVLNYMPVLRRTNHCCNMMPCKDELIWENQSALIRSTTHIPWYNSTAYKAHRNSTNSSVKQFEWLNIEYLGLLH